jgi:hypothetical protein
MSTNNNNLGILIVDNTFNLSNFTTSLYLDSEHTLWKHPSINKKNDHAFAMIIEIGFSISSFQGGMHMK